jgi:predicted SAM-dependent methyltransferase
MTFKQRFGRYFFRHLPVSRHVFDHFRLEINAIWVRIMHTCNPFYIEKVSRLRKKKNLLVNIGCGPFGKESGWINLDLFPIKNVYIRTDCRKNLILADNSCIGIHVEMFLEHLDPKDELPFFLKECYRCLDINGVLRVIVPDANKFIRGYLSPGWDLLNKISYGSEDWSKVYSCKMEAINHVFLQDYEHYGGWDEERLTIVLQRAGFNKLEQVSFAKGKFPGIPIDREYHKENGLYFECIK